jgi:acyl-CoA thioester hydrolase
MQENIAFKHSIPAQLRWNDVDQFGHVNNSIYFQLYDLAKTAYLKDVAGTLLDKEHSVVIANVNANFIAPIFLEDDIELQTTVTHLGTTSFKLAQRVVDSETQEVKCTCDSIMVHYKVATQEAAPLSENFKSLVRAYEPHNID